MYCLIFNYLDIGLISRSTAWSIIIANIAMYINRKLSSLSKCGYNYEGRIICIFYRIGCLTGVKQLPHRKELSSVLYSHVWYQQSETVSFLLAIAAMIHSLLIKIHSYKHLLHCYFNHANIESTIYKSVMQL